MHNKKVSRALFVLALLASAHQLTAGPLAKIISSRTVIFAAGVVSYPYIERQFFVSPKEYAKQKPLSLQGERAAWQKRYEHTVANAKNLVKQTHQVIEQSTSDQSEK